MDEATSEHKTVVEPEAASSAAPRVPVLALVAIVLFFSGACSLVYQVVWLRLIRLVFGVSTPATAATVAIFMGGLGLGGAYFGRVARRSPRPLRLYALLELGIALAAAATPALTAGARSLYISLGGVSELGLTGATVVRLLLAALVLGLPTTLMGGTLPAVAQALQGENDRGRRLVAALYGINTLGAVAGALLATFFLVERFGMRGSLGLAVAVNLGLAGIAALAARGLAARPPAPEPKTHVETTEASATGRLILVVAGAVGFFFFAMELVWYRMLAPILGGSSYSFGAILAVALLGIGLGGFAYSLGERSRRPTLAALGATCALEAICLLIPFALGDRLSLLAAALRGLDVAGFPAVVAGWLLVSGIVVFPAALVAGYQFPLLVALLGEGRGRVGVDVGDAYAWNTLGAVLGSILGGFVMIPVLTATASWRLLAALLAVLGLVVALAARRRQGRWALAAPALLGLAVLPLVDAEGPTAFWRHVPIGAGRARLAFSSATELQAMRLDVRRSVVAEREGVESSVALRADNDLSLVINGKSDGSARGDAPTQVMTVLVGAARHPAPRRGLVVGLGTGSSAGWMAAVPEIERVDVVELEPAVVELAAQFAAVNRLGSPKVRFHAGDGRELVASSRERYDLVFSQPSNPYRAGVADLFSADYYRAIRERLAPGGVLVQWLQGYEVDARVMRIAYATLSTVFPVVETWVVHRADLLLVASLEPLPFDAERLRERARSEPFASALRWTWGVDDLEGLLSGYFGGPPLARAIAADPGVEVSTDDRPVIEYGYARAVGTGRGVDFSQMAALAKALGADRPPGAGAVDWARVGELRRSRAANGSLPPDLAPPESPEQDARQRARRAWVAGRLPEALAAWRSQGEGPIAAGDRVMLAETLADAGDPAAPTAIAELAAGFPTDARAIAARHAWRIDDVPRAGRELLAFLAALREDGWGSLGVAGRALELVEPVVARLPEERGAFAAALDAPFAATLLDNGRLQARLALLAPVDCVAGFAAYEPYPRWEEGFLRARAACYEAAADPHGDRARRELAAFLAAAPQPLLEGVFSPIGRPRPPG